MEDDLLVENFVSNVRYFEVMRRHHASHGGAAIEPEVAQLIDEYVGRLNGELGCGEGSILRHLSCQHGELFFVGVDVSPIGIRMARERAPANAGLSVAHLSHLPFRPGTFDLLYSQSVLEHLVDYRAALREAYGALRSGGHVVVRVGNGGARGKSAPRTLVNYLLGLNRSRRVHSSFVLRSHDPVTEVQDHRTNFDAWEIPSDVLARDLVEAGFRITYLETRPAEWPRTGASLKRLLKRGLYRLRFFPFNHLGPVTIVAGRKED